MLMIQFCTALLRLHIKLFTPDSKLLINYNMLYLIGNYFSIKKKTTNKNKTTKCMLFLRVKDFKDHGLLITSLTDIKKTLHTKYLGIWFDQKHSFIHIQILHWSGHQIKKKSLFPVQKQNFAEQKTNHWGCLFSCSKLWWLCSWIALALNSIYHSSFRLITGDSWSPTQKWVGLLQL